MSDNLSELNFRQDLQEALQADDAKQWKFDLVGPLEIYVSMSSASTPEEIFQARLEWRVYPGEPPSLKFRDPATGRLDLPTAWPMLPAFRPQSLDACVNWCVEGFKLHPEWTNDPMWKWNSVGNRVLWVIRTLKSQLDQHNPKRFGQ